MIRKLCKKQFGTWWEPIRCIWPYPEGYAVHCKRKNTVLDTGLTRARAQEICDELNAKEES